MSVDIEEDLEHRRRAEQWRAQAADHRARAHELRAGAVVGDDGGEGGGDAFLHAGIEEILADVAELRAEEFEMRAEAVDTLARAEGLAPDQRERLLREVADAVLRAAALEQRADALSAGLEADAEVHEAALTRHLSSGSPLAPAAVEPAFQADADAA